MSSSKNHRKVDQIPGAEWIVAGAGLVLVSLALAFLGYKALFVERGNPSINFRVEEVISQEGGSLVLASVKNSGGQTVTELQVLGSAGQVNHEVIIDFVPAHSSRRFGLFFPTEVSIESVKLEAGSYQQP